MDATRDLMQHDADQQLAAETYGFGSHTPMVDWQGDPIDERKTYLIYKNQLIDMDEAADYLIDHGAEEY